MVEGTGAGPAAPNDATNTPGIGGTAPGSFLPKPGENAQSAAAGSTDPQLKYPLGSKYMILDRSAAAFTPKVGEIYIDEANETAFKIVGAKSLDSQGNRMIPTARPDFKEVLEYYKIPRQDVKLNRGNIAYLSPGVQLLDSPPPSSASAPSGSAPMPMMISGAPQGETHVFRIPAGYTIYEYPEPPKNNTQQAATDSLPEEAKSFKGGDVMTDNGHRVSIHMRLRYICTA